MTAAELVQGVQFTVDQQGRITAVVITPELWARIVDALEDTEDHDLVRDLRAKLAIGPEAAGALRWDAIAGDWT